MAEGILHMTAVYGHAYRNIEYKGKFDQKVVVLALIKGLLGGLF